MQSLPRERSTATTTGTLARARAVIVMLFSIANVRAFRPTAVRTAVSSRALADRVHSTRHDAVGARPIGARPGESEVDAPSFFERVGSPRFIAAPMVEQSEAGEFVSVVLFTTSPL